MLMPAYMYNSILIIIQYVLQFTQQMPDIARVYYIEIVQLITNRNAITLVCYLGRTL